MTTLTLRPYAGEADLPVIAAMLHACEQFDQFEEINTVDTLRQEFSEPGFNPTRDIQLWEEDGRLVGFGQLWVSPQRHPPDGFLWYRVLPEARGNGLDEQIIAWGEETLRSYAHELGIDFAFTATAHERQVERHALLQRLGFTPIRYFLRKGRDLREPLPEPVFPAGFTLHEGPHDPEAWVALYNESFIDHFGHRPMTVEQLRHHQSDPTERPDLNLILVAPDGTPAAFAWCGINPEENELNNRQDGWVFLLGTRRGYRRIGLGRALLLEGMRRLRDAGMTFARLGVDADSPTGATHLYESVGFQDNQRRTLYARNLKE
jgi:mycothiol synthase